MFDDFFSMGDDKPAHIKPVKTIPIVEVKKHARLGASNSPRWTICHKAPRLEDGLPDTSGDAAEIGTICHDLGEKCLKADDDVLLTTALGKRAIVESNGLVIYQLDQGQSVGHVVTDKMTLWASMYIELIRDFVRSGARLMVEARLSIEHITGEADAMGTSDSVLLWPEELCIADLKCGFQKVFAKYPLEGIDFSTAPNDFQMRSLFGTETFKPNTQLVIYAEAARNELAKKNPEAYARIKRIRLIVVQPTLDHVDEFVLSIEDHLAWIEWIRQQAEATRSDDAKAVPGPKQCQFCKAYPCFEAEQAALDTAFEDFAAFDEERVRRPSVHELSKLKSMLPMLRKYCDYIEARVYAEFESGRSVAGYKLVEGEKGDREWANPFAADLALKAAGIDDNDRYKSKLISPAQAEAMTRGKRAKLSKGEWEKLQQHIIRPPASGYKVVEASDPRPAVTIDISSYFDDQGGSSEGLTDFFNT